MLFAFSGVCLTWLSAPGSAWLDTGEFGAVAWSLDLSHPPGHPLHALLTKGIQLSIPIGDLGFRSALGSVLCLGLALGCLFRLGCRLLPDASRAVIGGWCLLPLLATPVVLQGVRAEVYALQILLSVILAERCFAVSTGQDRRALLMLCLIFGLAGSNHSYIGLYWVPFALLAILMSGLNLRQFNVSAGFGLLGLSTYLYLPIRAGRGDEIGWGLPHTPDAFWDTITGRAWRHNLVPSTELPTVLDTVTSLAGSVFLGLGALSVIMLLLIVVAVPDWVKQRRWLALVVGFAVVLPFSLRVGTAVDLSNPDLGGYLASGFIALILLALVAFETLGERGRRFACVGLFVALAWTVWERGFSPGVEHDRGSERYARGALDEVPVGGALVVADYSTLFSLWSLRSFEDVRPDVGIVYRGQVHSVWLAERLASRHPSVAAKLGEFPHSFLVEDARWEPGVRLETLGDERRRLIPTGLMLSTDAQFADPARLTEALSVFNETSFWGRRFRALWHVHLVEHLRAIGGPSPLIQFHLDQLTALAPDDPLTQRLTGGQ